MRFSHENLHQRKTTAWWQHHSSHPRYHTLLEATNHWSFKRFFWFSLPPSNLLHLTYILPHWMVWWQRPLHYYYYYHWYRVCVFLLKFFQRPFFLLLLTIECSLGNSHVVCRHTKLCFRSIERTICVSYAIQSNTHTLWHRADIAFEWWPIHAES